MNNLSLVKRFGLKIVWLFVPISFISCQSFALASEKLDLKILANLNETYDDNITYLKEKPIDDFITDAALGLGLNYEGKTGVLELLGRITQHFFANHADFNNTCEDFMFSLKNELSKKDSMAISDTFTHAQEPRSFEDAFGRTTGRYSYLKNEFSMAYTRAISKMLSFLARFSNESDYFSRKDIIDSAMNSIGLQMNYILSSATILLFSNDFSRRDFYPGRNASTDAFLAGVKQYLTSQLSFEAKAGLDFLNSYNASKYTKPMVSLSFIDEMDKNTRSVISFTKRYYTNAYEEDLFDYQEFSAEIIEQLSERLGINFSGFYGKGKYISLGIADTLRGAGLGFVYDLRQNIRLKISYAYSDATSNSDTRAYKKNLFSLGVTSEF